MIDYSNLLLDAVHCAQEAGKIHLSYFRKGNYSVQAKHGNESDIVTSADKAAETSIINFIHTHYPTHSILSEESGSEVHDAEYTWVIDPLDGTTNFSSGLPMFSVSIGIMRNGVTIVGVVYAPYLGELFHAVIGEGAFLNGEKIACGTRLSLDKCVVATGFPVDKDRTPDNNLDNVARIMPQVRGVRRLGSAAIDISYVAAGFLDAYWELNLHEWDVCAGLLIAREAGAESHHFRHDRNISVLVASPAISALMLPLLSTCPGRTIANLTGNK